MKKWLLAAAVCVLTACSSGGESKTYYQLPVAQGGAQSAASQGRVCCGLSRSASRITWRVTGWSIRPPTCSM